MDPEYIEMMNYIESDTDFEDLAPDCELKQMKEFMDRMSLVTLDGGNRLIVKDETEILIPKGQRKQLIETVHSPLFPQCSRFHDITVQTQNILAGDGTILTEKV